MPSLADIPVDLMEPNKQLDFLHWLVALPIGIAEAKTLMRLWAQSQSKFFRAEHWDFVERQFRNPRRG